MFIVTGYLKKLSNGYSHNLHVMFFLNILLNFSQSKGGCFRKFWNKLFVAVFIDKLNSPKVSLTKVFQLNFILNFDFKLTLVLALGHIIFSHIFYYL